MSASIALLPGLPTMKIVSFNINGLRARPHQLAALIEKHQPDVIGLQETKVHDDQFPLEEVRAGLSRLFPRSERPLRRCPAFAQSRSRCTKASPAMKKTPSGALSGAPSPTPMRAGDHHERLFPQGESRDHPTKFPAKQRFYSDLQPCWKASSTTTSRWW
jgi:exodeoxyribonuclease-3